MKLIDLFNLYVNKDKVKFNIFYHNKKVYENETIENIIESEKDLLNLSILDKNIDKIEESNSIYIKSYF